jgi:3-oxoacid CoA-transferase subunit A
MKTQIFNSFDEAIADIFDGAVIAFSTFGSASQAMNLWEALYRKDVKDLTIIGNMVMPAIEEGAIPSYGPTNCVLQPGKIKKAITGFTSMVYTSKGTVTDMDEFAVAMSNIEVEPTTFGNICTRLEAAASGYGGILTPVGVGTFFEEQREKFTIDGREYLLEKPLVPDFGFIKAWKADKLGNLVYWRGQRLHNPLIARAAKVTIAEVLEIVEPGEIDPDNVHTPHIYVDRMVKVPEGGMGSFGWNEVIKEKSFGPGGFRRQQMESASERTDRNE